MEEERLRPPSPPPVVHYTDHEAAAVSEKIKQDDTFTKAVQVFTKNLYIYNRLKLLGYMYICSFFCKCSDTKFIIVVICKLKKLSSDLAVTLPNKSLSYIYMLVVVKYYNV